MPPRRILLIPGHSLWRANNLHLTRLRPAQKPSFPFHQPTAIIIRPLPFSCIRIRMFLFTVCATLDIVMVDMYTSVLRVAVRSLDRPLDSRDEVKVAIERCWSHQLVAPEVCGWIAHAGALRPGFVATAAGQ